MQDFIQNIVFALIAGFSEFLPVSAPAHYTLYQYITNRSVEPLIMLAVHLGCLVACIICCNRRIKRLRLEKRHATRRRKGRGNKAAPAALAEHAVLKAAVVPAVLGFLLYRKSSTWIVSIGWLSFMLLLGGIVQFIPRLISHGNKDGRMLSPMDGVWMGVGSALGVVPGFSRIGCCYTVGIARGAERSHIVDDSLILSIPPLAVMSCFDLYGVFTSGSPIDVMAVLMFLAAAIVSFACGYLAVALLKFFSAKADLSGFAYYGWGLSLFVFLLYLIIH